MYDTELIRKLCADIGRERDSERVHNLIALLQAVIKDDQEEIRVRMAFLQSRFAAVVSDAKGAD